MSYLYIPPHARLPQRSRRPSLNVCSTPTAPFVVSRGVRTVVANSPTTTNLSRNNNPVPCPRLDVSSSATSTTSSTPASTTSTTPKITNNSNNVNRKNIESCQPQQRRPYLPPLDRTQKHPNPNKHTNDINHASRQGDLSLLESSVRAAKADRYVLNVLNYTAIAEGYIRAKRPMKAFDTFAEMRAYEISPTAASIRVATKAAQGVSRINPELAIEVILTMINWSVDCGTLGCPRTWNICINTLLHTGATDHAVGLLLRMIHESSNNEAIPFPQACSFNQIITHLGRSKRFDEALSLFGTMLVGHFCREFPPELLAQVSPDVVTFNSILDAALIHDGPLPTRVSSSLTNNSIDNRNTASQSNQNVNRGKYRHPNHHHRQKLQQQQQEPQSQIPTQHFNFMFVESIVACMQRRNVKPDLLTETLILRLIARVRSRERQRGIQSNRLAPDPDNISAETLLHLRRLVRTRIQQAIDRMAPSLDKPFFDAALIALGATKDINMIIKIFNTMHNRAIRPDLFTIRALLKYTRASQDASLAYFLIRTAYCLRCLPDHRMYTTAITSCMKQPSVALSILELSLDKGLILSSGMVNAAISTTGHDVHEAIKLWQKIRSKTAYDEKASERMTDRVVYDALFRVCGRSGSPRDALRIWYASKNAGHVKPQSQESRAMFNAFMRGLDEREKHNDVDRNIFKNTYLRLLKVECGVPDNIDWPVERIRIKW